MTTALPLDVSIVSSPPDGIASRALAARLISSCSSWHGSIDTTGSLAAAFASSAAVKFLVVSFTSDWLYPSYHSKELVRALHAVGADVSYLDIASTWGHDAFLLEVDTMTRLIESFLDRLTDEEGVAPP